MVEEAEEDLFDQVVFSLDEKAFKHFQELCRNPHTPDENLRRFLSSSTPFPYPEPEEPLVLTERDTLRVLGLMKNPEKPNEYLLAAAKALDKRP